MPGDHSRFIHPSHLRGTCACFPVWEKSTRCSALLYLESTPQPFSKNCSHTEWHYVQNTFSLRFWPWICLLCWQPEHKNVWPRPFTIKQNKWVICYCYVNTVTDVRDRSHLLFTAFYWFQKCKVHISFYASLPLYYHLFKPGASCIIFKT